LTFPAVSPDINQESNNNHQGSEKKNCQDQEGLIAPERLYEFGDFSF